MTSADSRSVDIADEAMVAWVDLERVRALIEFLLDRLRLDPGCTVSVAFVDEERMTQLHLQWMDEPGPTDVLSFPMDDLQPGPMDGPAPVGILGDIVVCPSVAEKQAIAAGHEAAVELDLLITHGMLHLLGFDHADPADHEQMFGLQGELLEQWRSRLGAAS